MRITAISDMHGFLPDPNDMGSGDLLLIAGDICPVRDHGLQRQYDWLQETFRPWLNTLNFTKIVGVAGNHDFIAQASPADMYDLPWEYLEDEPLEFDDHVIYGTPWTPQFGPWAFMGTEEQLSFKWESMPDSTTILLSHGPMAGYGGNTARGVDAGSTTMRKRIEQLDQLRFHVFGHIHEAFGDYERYPEGRPWVLHSNVSFVDLRYRPRPLADLRRFEF